MLSSQPVIVGTLISGAMSIALGTVTYLRGAEETPFRLVNTLAQVLPGELVPGFLFASGIASLCVAWRMQPSARPAGLARRPAPRPAEWPPAALGNSGSDLIARLQESFDPNRAYPTSRRIQAI